MIQLTKLNKKQFILNCDLVETIESTPDTVITLRNGKIYIVAETPDEIVALVSEFRRSLYADLLGR